MSQACALIVRVLSQQLTLQQVCKVLPGKELETLSVGSFLGTSNNLLSQAGDVLLDKLKSLEEPVEAHVLVGSSEDIFIVLLPLFQIVQEPRQQAEAGKADHHFVYLQSLQ